MSTLTLLSAAALILIWLAYPLAIALVARIYGTAAVPEPDQRRRVSVVLATRESPTVIQERLADLLRNGYPLDRLQIIVGVDRMSPLHALPSFADLSPTVEVVWGDSPGGKAATLNAAVRAATGEILVFTDSAQRFDTGAIAKLVGSLWEESVGAVTGALELIPDRSSSTTLVELYWRFERWLRSQEARIHSSVGVTGAIYAIPRKLWKPLPAGLILDDLYTPMRLVLDGWRIAFHRDAVAFDRRRTSAGQEHRRKVRTLTGVVQLTAWMPEVLIPLRNPIWLQFIFHKLLRFATPYLAVLIVLGGVAAIGSRLTALPGMTGAGLLLLFVVSMSLLLLNRRARRLVIEVIYLQLAVVRATLNGTRGRWDVWS